MQYRFSPFIYLLCLIIQPPTILYNACALLHKNENDVMCDTFISSNNIESAMRERERLCCNFFPQFIYISDDVFFSFIKIAKENIKRAARVHFHVCVYKAHIDIFSLQHSLALWQQQRYSRRMHVIKLAISQTLLHI